MDFGPFFNGHFKPKIVKIGLVISSGGAAQNMKIFFLKRLAYKIKIFPYFSSKVGLKVLVQFVFMWKQLALRVTFFIMQYNCDVTDKSVVIRQSLSSTGSIAYLS